MTAPDLPAALLRYIEIRDRQHAEVVEHALGEMTERERRLVREAAVMGYVQGTRLGAAQGWKAEIPPDGQILESVVDACLSVPDLYPVMDYVANGPREDGEDR